MRKYNIQQKSYFVECLTTPLEAQTLSKTTQRVWIIFSFLLAALFSQSVLSQGIHSVIEKIDSIIWTVEYKASQPIERIAFKRNPDNSRISRWKPIEDNFRVFFINNEEFIGRKDGKLFTQVKLYLTPRYKHLPKDYAPFSPFSDGGMLIHSGRFFACENECDDSLNEWSFKLSIPSDEHIIINGMKVGSETIWVDSDNGMSIYIGQQAPLGSDGFLTLVDAGLPKSIKDALETDIPKMTAYFKSRLGDLPDGLQPTLYASYSKAKGTSVQGGVLPNQIFIHWDKNDLEEFVEDEIFISDLLWTFAHEVAHYYQRFDSTNITPSESWIHEGHAELLAYDTLTSLYPSVDEYREMRVTRFKKNCANDLESTSLKDAAINGKFQAYYSCGFLIHQLISNGHKSNYGHSATPYATWKLFRTKTEAASKTAQETFLDSITELTSENLSESIRRFVNLKHVEPYKVVEAFTHQREF
jgi:hypothetical protein